MIQLQIQRGFKDFVFVLNSLLFLCDASISKISVRTFGTHRWLFRVMGVLDNSLSHVALQVKLSKVGGAVIRM